MRFGTPAPRALPSRPRKSGWPDLRIIECETRAGPGFVAGRVERSGEAAERGVGGLRLLRIRGGAQTRLLRASGAPHPRPLPATRFARGGRGAESACVRVGGCR